MSEGKPLKFPLLSYLASARALVIEMTHSRAWELLTEEGVGERHGFDAFHVEIVQQVRV